MAVKYTKHHFAKEAAMQNPHNDPIYPPEPVCMNCKHYVPHFTRTAFGAFSELSTGHCTHPRCKARKMTDTCDSFNSRFAETGTVNRQ